MTIRILFFLGIISIAACTADREATAREADLVGPEAKEAHKAIARRWFEEVINDRNLDAIFDIYATDYVYHGPEQMELRGPDEVREFAASILEASNDRHAVVEQQIAEGNLVVTRFTSRGHHTGTFRGIEATGNILTTEGIVISRIRNGKIVEDWEVIHTSGL